MISEITLPALSSQGKFRNMRRLPCCHKQIKNFHSQASTDEDEVDYEKLNRPLNRKQRLSPHINSQKQNHRIQHLPHRPKHSGIKINEP